MTVPRRTPARVLVPPLQSIGPGATFVSSAAPFDESNPSRARSLRLTVRMHGAAWE
jgi:hypothetical protein